MHLILRGYVHHIPRLRNDAHFHQLYLLTVVYYQYFHNDINYDADFHEALKKVTLAEVKSVAEKYMIIKNPITVVVR